MYIKMLPTLSFKLSDLSAPSSKHFTVNIKINSEVLIIRQRGNVM